MIGRGSEIHVRRKRHKELIKTMIFIAT